MVHLVHLLELNGVVQHNGEEFRSIRQLVNNQGQDLWTKRDKVVKLGALGAGAGYYQLYAERKEKGESEAYFDDDMLARANHVFCQAS